MYKVFCNDRIFFFTDDKEIISSNSEALVLEYFDNYNLSNFWNIVSKNKDHKHIFLHSNNPELLIYNFECNYQILTAAGGVVENEKGEIILIERLGKMDLPKGKTENNESIEETAIREVEEECGIQGVSIGSEIQITQHTYIQDKQQILKRTHWFKMSYNGDEQLTPQSKENITKAFWTKKTDIKELLNENNTYLSILDIFSTLGY